MRGTWGGHTYRGLHAPRSPGPEARFGPPGPRALGPGPLAPAGQPRSPGPDGPGGSTIASAKRL